MIKKEVWLRNEFVIGVIPLLQPVANALLQASEEIVSFMESFPDTLLWSKPVNCAAVGFHLKHITGFLDRLYTYAKGDMLTEDQLAYLQKEEISDIHSSKTLTENTAKSLHAMVRRLEDFSEADLTATRYVGRAKIPTTTIGLLFHAAEHTMRHTGQLLVTVALLKNESSNSKKEN